MTQSLTLPLEQLAVATKSTQGTIRKWASFQVQEKDKTKKTFDKIPSDYKRMLLIAYGEGQVIPDTLNPEAMTFFALPNVKTAHIHLNSLLESEKVRCSISLAMANHLYAASFRWVNMIRPSGFASSILTTESYLRTDVLNEAMVLDVSTRFDISEEYVTKLTETTIIFPDNCEDMIERFKTMKVLANYFFGSSNIIIRHVIHQLKSI